MIFHIFTGRLFNLVALSIDGSLHTLFDDLKLFPNSGVLGSLGKELNNSRYTAMQHPAEGGR